MGSSGTALGSILKSRYFLRMRPFQSNSVLRRNRIPFAIVLLVFAFTTILVIRFILFQLSYSFSISHSSNNLAFNLSWKTQNPKYNSLSSSGILSKNVPFTVPFAVVTDQDKASKRPEDTANSLPRRWVAYLRRGELAFQLNDALDFDNSSFSVTWSDSSTGIELWSRINEDGRGMELSDLIWFQSKLLAPDDRTGVLYEIVQPNSAKPFVAPRDVLPDGDGNTAKGFKGEWMVEKDNELVIGGHGREITDPYNGMSIKGRGGLWIKVLDRFGGVRHHDWTEKYNRLRKAVGAEFPGYLIHEAVLWSALRREWVFLPRRYSTSAYNERENERRGWNRALIADEEFREIRELPIKLPKIPERGFSAAQFIPKTQEKLVLALRTVEVEGISKLETFVSVFSIETGNVLMSEMSIGDLKYEGLAFFPV
mmetsp:Transcript_10263/g.18488  ORF Transcript_10263/g.18488 Transcript_10263/m.18488 type:complete len:425 (-) Transcript_10263:3454-4728(-)